MSEERIIQLQEKLAHQEHLLDSLNEIVTSQQQEINELKVAIRHLLERMRSLSTDGPESLTETEIPPHY